MTITQRKFKPNCFKVMSALCLLLCPIFYIFSYLNNKETIQDKGNKYSFIFLGLFVVVQSLLIFCMKTAFKKFYYYVDVLEFIGYIGIFILVVTPLILVILYAIFYSELGSNNPVGNNLFLVLGKAILSSCVCDLSFAFILKYFSLKIAAKLFIVNFSIIYLIFKIVTGNNIRQDYFFLTGFILGVIILILLMVNIYMKNAKKQISEINERRMKTTL